MIKYTMFRRPTYIIKTRYLPAPVNSADSAEFTGTFEYHISTTNTPIKLIHCLISGSEYRSDTSVSGKNLCHEFIEIYERSIRRGLLNVVHDTKNFWTMTPQPTCKRLGVGASCTVKLRFLHPKNQVKDKIPNQTSSQQLTGLIVQSNVEKIIHKVNKDCIMF